MAWPIMCNWIGVGVQCDAYCDWKFGDINVNLSQDVKYTENNFFIEIIVNFQS